ncbi:hypothetical protein [Nocardia cyriacigeorgica]|uniref:hypothetical protein n=1 Tax=Nocardia cyriacigeorgica TaxID=135487 RepID=UPI0014860E2F|nr:hypothetical protein [Nocardia cyriacigeorgica]
MRGSGAVRTKPRSNGPSTQADPLLSAAHPSGWRCRGAAATSPSGPVATNSPTSSPNGSRPDSSLRTIRAPPAPREPPTDHRPGAALRSALRLAARLLLAVPLRLATRLLLAMPLLLANGLPPPDALPPSNALSPGGDATAASGWAGRIDGADEESQGGVMAQLWRAREPPNGPDPPPVDNPD